MKGLVSLFLRFPAAAILAVLAALTFGACANTPKSPDVAAAIRRQLDQTGLRGVSVSQDRDKGVITLGGNVEDDRYKQQADAIARALAAGQVVANEIAVVPRGVSSDARKVNSDIDKGIEQNLDAALISNRLHDRVKYSVKNQVVTLSGNVDSEEVRSQAQQVSAAVPYVNQVVNELQVKDQKATSSK